MIISEQEILELAAKAYGIPVYWDQARGDMSSHDYPMGWNPLWDNDDCANMEARLGISVIWHPTNVEVSAGGIVWNGFYEDHNGDKVKARRFASTKLASLIGQTM